MFAEEAEWIGRALETIDPTRSPIVGNLGSSTRHFRTVIQPHIERYIFAPLAQRGFRVQHIDLKHEDGVDVVADITTPDFGQRFCGAFNVVLCTNLLEHVRDIPAVVRRLVDCCVDDGYLLITVPYRYRRHLDPIDNMFRPLPVQIRDLFPIAQVSMVTSAIITIHDKHMYAVKRSRYPLWGYRDRIGYYLGRRHKVSGVLLRLSK